MKREPEVPRFLVLALLLFLSTALAGGTPSKSIESVTDVSVPAQMEALSQLLRAADIATETKSGLIQQALRLGLSPDGTQEQLRERLLAYYGIEETIQRIEEEDDQVILEILSAGKVHMQAKRVLLEGRVRVRFTLLADGTTSLVEADRLLLDRENSRVTAMGSVYYQGPDERLGEHLNGHILTIYFVDGDLKVTDARMEAKRTNSAGEQVTFYTSASDITYQADPNSSMLTDATITTQKDVDNAYFSIQAKELYLLSGGDLFVEHANISLGRVPLVYLPLFYYPGKTFVFNPAMGIDTQRGMFVFTTTEVYGSYPPLHPSDQDGFTSLFTAEQDTTRVRSGWVYEQASPGAPEQNAVQQWAQESGSYLAILGDAYQYGGTFFGIDTRNRFFGDQYLISLLGGVAYSGTQYQNSVLYTIPSVRYLFKTQVSVDTEALTLSVQAPYYSDVRVMRDYGNRLTSFLSALGTQGIFADTYRGDIPSFNWRLDGSARIPVDPLSPFIESFTISRVSGVMAWDAHSGDVPGYYLSSMTFPDLRATMKGTLFRFSQKTSASLSVDETVKYEDLGADLARLGFAEPYRAPMQVPQDIQKYDVTSLSLQYHIEHDLTSEYEYEEEQALSTALRYSDTVASLLFSGVLAPSYLTCSERLESGFTVNETDASHVEHLYMDQVLDVKLPFLGISYGLTNRFYDMTDDGQQSGGWASWNENTVRRHQLGFLRDYPIGDFVISPSIVSTLSPLPWRIEPKLSLQRGFFGAFVAYRMDEDEHGLLSGEQVTLSFLYDNKKSLALSSQATYDVASEQTIPIDVDIRGTWKAKDGALVLDQRCKTSCADRSFDYLITSLKIPWATFSLQGSGSWDDITWELLDTTVRLPALQWKWWKDRMWLGVELASSYQHSFVDPYASNFHFSLDLNCSIAEFLSLKIALRSENSALYRYEHMEDLLEDLLLSFDFFGEGRHTTQFTMENVDISLVHHMADWDLHCKYRGSVVLSDGEWKWSPVYTIYVQWKAIPEIRTERRFTPDG